jgi:uncharacterized protein
MADNLTHREIARRGGQKTLEVKGKDFYSEIGRKGGEATRQNRDSEYYRNLQKLGIESKRRKKLELMNEAKIA